MPEIVVRDADVEDAGQIARIYNRYVLDSTATFDTEPKTAEERQAWIAQHDERHPVVVAERDGIAVGWGSLTRWGDRPAWERTVEVSTYVDESALGTGVGSALTAVLLERALRAGHHAVVAQIVGDNEASLRISERFGFERVGGLG
ncbi:MAG: GNAT family N-acetyltransferase, partial [Coriobacteriia bacterium]|nr:GNAT family N-acetyltransferase [Coriobacteriia bacterium]